MGPTRIENPHTTAACVHSITLIHLHEQETLKYGCVDCVRMQGLLETCQGCTLTILTNFKFQTRLN